MESNGRSWQPEFRVGQLNTRPFPAPPGRRVTAGACSGPPCRSVVTMMHEAVLRKLGRWTGTKEKQDCDGRTMVSERAFVSKSKTFHFMWKPFCVTRSHGIYITYTCMKKHIRLHPAGPPNYLKPAARESVNVTVDFHKYIPWIFFFPPWMYAYKKASALWSNTD